MTPEERQKKEIEIAQWGKDNGKSLIETKAALARFRNEQAVKPVVQPTETASNTGAGATKAGNVLGSIFGGNKIGEAIGNQIAKGNLGDTVQRAVIGRDISPEDEALVQNTVTGKQIAGDVGRTAATFLPVGKIAGLASKGLGAIGLGRAAKYLGGIAAGGTAGATFDVTNSIAEGQTPELGAGTVIGSAIPAATPLLGALARGVGAVTGRATSEVAGALTGTSQENIEQAYRAAKAGGQQLDEFTKAMRGNTTPESLVTTLRDQIDTVSTQRSQTFRNTLSELGDTTVSSAPAKAQFAQNLEQTGITVGENGILDFSKSKLRTVPSAQAKIQQAWMEVSNMPDNMSLVDLDTTRQAVKGIKSIAGDDPSANLANMLVEDAVRSVRKAGEQVDGYGKMLDEFGETSEFLNELNRGLSSGDNATVDQAYRRMTTSLKTNNEQRAALVRELDEMTDGAIMSGIAGQQMSEVLPRGIFRQILAGSAGVGAVTGTLTPALIPTLIFASPRVVGEFVRALGITAGQAEALLEGVSQARNLLIKAGAITGSEMGVETTSQNEQNQ